MSRFLYSMFRDSVAVLPGTEFSSANEIFQENYRQRAWIFNSYSLERRIIS